MPQADEEPIEVSEEELEAMVAEAIDIIALALPDDADDEYWAAFRQRVERRAKEIVIDDEDAD